MIAVEDLVVSYPAARANAVDGVSFVSPSGKITALAGPNGSGKSTIVRALLGRVDIVRGKAVIGGDDARSLAPNALAQRMAVVPQREDAAFPMRVRDYVGLGRYPHLGLWRSPASDDEEAIDQALNQSGIEELADRTTDALSGGEWQRVRIARALAQHAPALVLDEPTTFLDVA
ncbi:MAG TPA: ABC transporter ATP-binding protein, partial [Gemmatimonadaceae bacterium]|nr:ABC transporter ATP-binding protein [Gemmatimonadaceae bacterium]